MMELHVDIGFEQLVQVLKKMPEKQWLKLKKVIDDKEILDKDREEYKNILLNGPTFSNEQFEILDDNRKLINKWRER